MSNRKINSVDQLIKADAAPNSVINMVGKTYGYILIISYAGYYRLPSGSRNQYVFCRCKCGTEFIGNAVHIRFGNWISCGCHRVEHPNRFKHGYATTSGINREKIYVTWQSIHKRTGERASKDKARKYYEKGIKVCEGWSGKDGFVNFKKDMSPVTDKSIDRIDNDLHYSCGHCEECVREGWKLNCRWVNDDVQSNNRGSFNNWINVNGIKMTYRQADRYLGFPIKTIQGRVKTLGWSEEKAIKTPILKNNTRKTYK